jgi:hypothetical protein
MTKSQHNFIDFIDNVSQDVQGKYHRIQHLGKLEPKVSLKQWRKGSQWFEMSRELAIIVLSNTKYYPKFKNILSHSELCLIDEHYLPTVLNILKPTKIANQTLTYFMFPNNGTTSPHPFQWEPEMNTQEWIHELKEGYKFTYNGHREYNSNLSFVCKEIQPRDTRAPSQVHSYCLGD